jgi:hypothetical protein
MVNKKDAEVFIFCLSCHFYVGLFHVIGQEIPRWQFSMIHVCLEWQELAWDLSRVAWGLGIRTSRDTRFSTYDLLSICLIIVLAFTLTIQDAYDGGNESWWLVSNSPLGTPRGRYDEHISKSSLSCETKVYGTSRRKPNFRRWCLLASWHSEQWCQKYCWCVFT